MPEGDTVWLTAKRLHAALGARELSTFDLRVPALATVDLRGDSVCEALARGKHILIRLAGGLTLHNHLRMDGSWHIVRDGERPRGGPAHQIRALLGNREWLTAGFRVHDLRLVPTADEDQLVGHLGPDLLGPDWDAAGAVTRLAAQADRPIAEALLDQSNLAGIGNLYKSEILYVTRTHPWTPTASVRDLVGMVDTAHRLLWRNRDHPEQSTTGSLARGAQHWVYLRSGQPCRRCGETIRTALQGPPGHQRSTYWCPACQPT